MKEESLLLLSDLQKLINQVVLIDYTIIILGGDAMSIIDFIAVVSFGLACFGLGYTLGKDTVNAKK